MKNITVSIQGEQASNHDLAADRFFGDSHRLYRDNFKAPFEDVVGGSADFALVAIENSLVGGINEVYDYLRKYDLKIVGELYMHISHCLMVQDGVTKDDIKRIYSHPMALLQCEQYLSDNFTDAVKIESADTAGSAAELKNGSGSDCAAIASESAAKLHSLKILDREIEDFKQNYTRFIVLTHKKYVEKSMPKGKQKTSILLYSGNKPGSLYAALGSFAKRDINLSLLQSRPQPEKAWSYCFYTDVEAGITEKGLKQAIKEISENGYELEILGTYKMGETVN